ncbi:GTP binding protein [Mycena kentingensis (nom. inval.)]|nr:GTP binding protein [Mycena kentingensis (nom. inval.)]
MAKKESSLPPSLIPHLYDRPRDPPRSSPTGSTPPALEDVDPPGLLDSSRQPAFPLRPLVPSPRAAALIDPHHPFPGFESGAQDPSTSRPHRGGSPSDLAGPSSGPRGPAHGYRSPIPSDPAYRSSTRPSAPLYPGAHSLPPIATHPPHWREGDAGPGPSSSGQQYPSGSTSRQISPGFSLPQPIYRRATEPGSSSYPAPQPGLPASYDRFRDTPRRDAEGSRDRVALPPLHLPPGGDWQGYTSRPGGEGEDLPSLHSALQLHSPTTSTDPRDDPERPQAVRRSLPDDFDQNPRQAPRSVADESDHSARQVPMQRKILVACDFCRGRKLRCDGGRPICSNCNQRNQPCSYREAPKRRGPGKAAKGSRAKKAKKGGESSRRPGTPPSPASSDVPSYSTSVPFNFKSQSPLLPKGASVSFRAGVLLCCLLGTRSLTRSIAACRVTTLLGLLFRSIFMPDPTGSARRELNLLVAGCRGGKSSFLRLLLDTSDISPTASKEQLQSVARFVQGCTGHTPSLRTASVDIAVDGAEPLALTVVDTPSLDFDDDVASERVVADTLHFVESRLAEGGEDAAVAQTGDRYVHLCIYFLDPDRILPPSLPAPVVSRTRGNSFSQPDQESVILDPPLPSNPLLSRPTLPLAEINVIRRLSTRVNVLPVIARADTLPNDRLAVIKLAIRRGLADHGIGFGIFDVDQYTDDDAGPNASPSNSPPGSPATAPLLRLPYALFSPDLYSHSDGVPRTPLSRHELLLQYTPSQTSPKRNLRGKLVRSYRWATIDVLDPAHSDFVPLRTAIFHHMKALQKYTREYLFDKFRIERLPQRPSNRPVHQGQIPPPHLPPLSHVPRPVLAIDTAPRSAPIPRASAHPTPREIALGGDVLSAPIPRAPEASASAYPIKTPVTGTVKQRSKKITVACNFCRSRKLKCDGGRPSCGQCLKRSNACDYQPQNKRRGGPARVVKGDESESESDDKSAEYHDASMSPEMSSRRNSNFDTSPSMSHLGDRRDELPPITAYPSSVDQRKYFPPDHELPAIATLSLPEASPTTPGPMSAPSFPPLGQASEQQPRKRATTVPGKSSRLPSTSGPKVVACNFCRARKTKCDGVLPSCSSCVRRMLPCNYAHDSNGHGQRKASRRPSTSKGSNSPPSSRVLPMASSGYEQDLLIEGDADLKRTLEHSDAGRPSPPKKLKTDGSPEIP